MAKLIIGLLVPRTLELEMNGRKSMRLFRIAIRLSDFARLLDGCVLVPARVRTKQPCGVLPVRSLAFNTSGSIRMTEPKERITSLSPL